MQSKIANLIKVQPLFEEETDVINGCLLGDGTLSSSGKHYCLRVEHSINHRNYVWWKYTLLKRLTINKPKAVFSHQSIRFGTVGHPEITLMRKRWYGKDGIKKLPKYLSLSDLSVTIWFMDDGCRHRDTVDFSVHNFKVADIKRLKSILLRKRIESTINTDSKGYRLYILKKSYSVFKRLVKPYIVKCMAYKLP